MAQIMLWLGRNAITTIKTSVFCIMLSDKITLLQFFFDDITACDLSKEKHYEPKWFHCNQPLMSKTSLTD